MCTQVASKLRDLSYASFLVKSAVSTYSYTPLPTRTWLRAVQYFKILYGISS